MLWEIAVKETPLYQQHLNSGGKLIDFAGWAMPLHYGSQVAEHQAVRAQAGMFDVSHMNIVDLLGAGGRQLLRTLLANDVDKLNHPGQALYSCMLNPRGGVVDDLIVYYRGSDNYRLILNAGTREQDLKWIAEQADEHAVGIQTRADLAIIAIQGPEAIARVSQAFSPALQDAISTLKPFEAVDVGDIFVARTGYTGEDGLEILVPQAQAVDYWQRWLAAGITPCGLGARDSLRLEAGYPLYGQEMDQNITPLESGLAWTVAWEPQDRNFIGRAALELQRKQGVKQQLVGLVLPSGGMLRHGQTVMLNDHRHGVITSGGYSPTLKASIALARVPVNPGLQASVEIRGKLLPVTIVKPRFVKAGKVICYE
jgi:aminomethyltransferase